MGSTCYSNACNGNSQCLVLALYEFTWSMHSVHVWLCFRYDYVEMIKTAFVNNLSVVGIKRSNRRVEHCWYQLSMRRSYEPLNKTNANSNNIRALFPSVDRSFVCLHAMCYAMSVCGVLTILPLFNFKPYAHLIKLKQNGHNGIINKRKRKKEQSKWNTWKSKSKSKEKRTIWIAPPSIFQCFPPHFCETICVWAVSVVTMQFPPLISSFILFTLFCEISLGQDAQILM